MTLSLQFVSIKSEVCEVHLTKNNLLFLQICFWSVDISIPFGSASFALPNLASYFSLLEDGLEPNFDDAKYFIIIGGEPGIFMLPATTCIL